MSNEYEKVKKDFLSGRLKGCRLFFETNNYWLEAGYCYIILDNLEKAEECFEKIKDENVRADWALFLLQMLRADIKSFPTYFWVRNFLEVDLNLLILYCKENYVEKILKYVDFMAYYNPESYKFIGRAFWANNLMPASMFFLRRAKDKFYHDPELHYLLAYIYYKENNIEQCKKSLGACLELLPEYSPARDLYLKLIEKA